MVEPDDRRIAEGSRDAEDLAQEKGGETGGEQIHADADDDGIAAEHRRAIGEDEREDDRRDDRDRDAAQRAAEEIAADDRAEGADQKLALHRHVEDADAAAEHAGKGGEQDRGHRLDGGIDQGRSDDADHGERRPAPWRMARNRMMIACTAMVRTRGMAVSRCMAKPPFWRMAKKRPAPMAPSGSPPASRAAIRPDQV